jgi:endonuclease/exonuclease/phosphatase family metal-dependent hydrolase
MDCREATMKLLSWNIQWGRGMDGRVDLARVVRDLRRSGDFDVICLQEVAVNFPGLPGNDARDQVAELSRLLPGYVPIYRASHRCAGRAGRSQTVRQRHFLPPAGWSGLASFAALAE